MLSNLIPVNWALATWNILMTPIEPYTKRPAKFIKQVEFGDWRIKIYGISANTISVPDELVTKAIDKVLPHLPQTASRFDGPRLLGVSKSENHC
jgi:hypothetical protein